MGCHLLDALFSVLKIKHVEAVELVKDSGDGTAEMFPTLSIIRWDIPAGGGAACKVFWYDGGYLPSREVAGLGPREEFPTNAFVLVGARGKISSETGLLPAERMKHFKIPKPSIPRCASNHFAEWVAACKGGRPAFSNFADHGGPLSEMVLLGNLAIPPRGPKTRLGRPQHEMHQPAGGQPVSPPPVPKGLDGLAQRTSTRIRGRGRMAVRCLGAAVELPSQRRLAAAPTLEFERRNG